MPKNLPDHKGGHKGCGSNMNTITLQQAVGLCLSHSAKLDIQVKEAIEHISNKEEEGMEDDMDIYGAMVGENRQLVHYQLMDFPS